MSLPALDNLVRIGQLKAEPYNAAHAAALAALRWHGYRSENRYTVFQCLTHTMNWPAPRWRVLDAAHQKRNLAEFVDYAVMEPLTAHPPVIASVAKQSSPSA